MPLSLSLSENSNIISQSSLLAKELQDYVAFFTSEDGTDMMQYTYQDSGQRYDALTRNSEEYYVCRDEIENIKNNLDVIQKYMTDVTNVIEIGPGSEYPVEHKTLPILKCIRDLKCYYGLDSSATYLNSTMMFLRNNITNIQLRSIEADLLIGEISTPQCYGKKAILSFGITMGNFNRIQRDHVMTQLSKLAHSGDILIITFDINNDSQSLINAYTNSFPYGILDYFNNKLCNEFKQYAHLLKLQVTFDGQKVETYFEAQDSFSFILPGYGKISVSKGQKLRGITSNKFNKPFVLGMLNEHGFDAVETLSVSGKIITVICRKR